eukprot:TRINITY_DN1734_c0_g1_i1.p1 TRINITY_DN1734_c0_g1~~TRINITY_DN1734_c0_g1_i1.p1  ORF type:complete len:130 (-),score=5.06 TRINITY_DN1734_c0_g1_i1:108-497(-)
MAEQEVSLLSYLFQFFFSPISAILSFIFSLWIFVLVVGVYLAGGYLASHWCGGYFEHRYKTGNLAFLYIFIGVGIVGSLNVWFAYSFPLAVVFAAVLWIVCFFGGQKGLNQYKRLRKERESPTPSQRAD